MVIASLFCLYKKSQIHLKGCFIMITVKEKIMKPNGNAVGMPLFCLIAAAFLMIAAVLSFSRNVSAETVRQKQDFKLSAPVLVTVEPQNGSMKVEWKKVPGAVKYRLMRKDSSGWHTVADTGSLALKDATVKSGQRYTYSVCCVSADGKSRTSGYGNQKSRLYLATPSISALYNGKPYLMLEWKAVTGSYGYSVYRKTGSGSFEKIGSTTGTKWADKTAISGATYTYTVRCLDSDRKTPASGYVHKGPSVLRLIAPKLANTGQTSRGVTVRWTKIRGAGGYIVYRKSGGSGWKEVGRTTGIVFTDTSAVSGTRYTYTVRPYKGNTLGSYSEAGREVLYSDPVLYALKNTKTAKLTSQIMLVNDHTLSLWNYAGGTWQKVKECYCGYGQNGLRLANVRREGDRTSPIGSFPLTLAFGTGDNPGTLLPYRRITGTSYWSSEYDSTYNTWVESARPIDGEHLIEFYQYKYAMVIGFNMNPVVWGRGSAIFLHCKSYNHWYTGGCISVTEADMLDLMRTVKPGAYIMIVPNVGAMSAY